MSKVLLYVAIAACCLAALYSSDLLSFEGAQVSSAKALTALFDGRLKVNEEGVVTSLTLRGEGFKNSNLESLSSFPDLESLDLAATAITDESMDELAQLPKLKSLVLDNTSITDRGLASLKELPITELSLVGTSPGPLTLDGIGQLQNLVSLNLSGCEVDDRSAEALASLTNLRRLYLARTNMTSACLKPLSNLKNLELLNLAELALNNTEDIGSISNMASLELLYLDNAEFGDEAMTALANACDESGAPLNSLFLEGCDVSDKSQTALELLVTQPEFMKVRLTGTKVSRSVFDKIRKAAPDVSYSYGAGGESE